MEKLLSIIIPTYNMEKYLHKCLDSLIVSDENMQKLEILVINDGSKDLSSKIAHEYESKYPQTFRVIDKENGNYGSCINRGLKEATGKYIKVLDADDYFNNKIFNKFMNYLDNQDVDLVINDYQIVDEQDVVNETYSFRLPINNSFTLFDCPDSLAEWLWHHGITYRLAILREMSYKQTESISYTDDEWIFKPMKVVKSVSYFPEIVYCYLRGRVGQTFDDNVLKKSMGQKLQVAESMLEYYIEHITDQSDNFPPYLYQKLTDRISVLYNFIITKFSTDEENDRLKKLDQWIETKIPMLYRDLGEKKNRLGYSFIYNWRRKGYKRNRMSFLCYKFYSILLVLLHKGDNVPRMPVELKRDSN